MSRRVQARGFKSGRANLARSVFGDVITRRFANPPPPLSLSFSLAVNPNKNVPLFDSTRHDIFIRIKRDRVPVPEEGVAVRCLQKTFFFPENSRSARFFSLFPDATRFTDQLLRPWPPVRRVRLIKFTLEVPRVNEIRVSMEFRVDVLLSRLSE